MAQANINLSIDKNTFSKSKVYNNIYENVQEIDNTDGFINILSVSTTKGANTVSNIKAVCVYNESNVGVELQFVYQEWQNNSNVDEQSAAARYATMLLPAGDFIYLPNGRLIGYSADASAANATDVTNAVPDANMYTVLDVDGTNEAIDASETAIDVDDGDFFKRGDLIRIDNEIMEVTEISTNTLTVKRGVHGSTKASHDLDGGDGRDIRLPFFNAYNNFDKYSVAQTNKSGKFKAMNFFGYGRTATTVVDGFVPGSIAFKFYSQGYQELGLSGITPNTNTGLAASTEYKINITVDGGSVFENLAFTTDSSNTNFGGKNGVLNKIQDALNVQFYTSGNLFEKRIAVGIVDGDVRFTSGSHLSGSAILLAAPTSGTTPFGVGRIPAIGSIESAVAAKLPDDTLFNKVTYEENPNIGAFMYDDGNGNLIGVGTGTINYETGAIDFTAMPNAEFVINATYVSAHSGGTNVTTSGGKNHIQSIGARSINQKLNATVKVIALN
tara:strand:+ start:645 stop:2141 length:1497 start_codon:yes stop_codon:yes gene_type:complete